MGAGLRLSSSGPAVPRSDHQVAGLSVASGPGGPFLDHGRQTFSWPGRGLGVQGRRSWGGSKFSSSFWGPPKRRHAAGQVSDLQVDGPSGRTSSQAWVLPALEPPAWLSLSASPMARGTSCHLAGVTLGTHLGMVYSLVCVPGGKNP